MSKNTNTQGTTVIDANAKDKDNNTQMDQTTTQTNDEVAVVLPVAGRAVLTSNDAKTSHRLTWMKEGREWDAAKDLSLLDLSQASAGLEAIANYVSGGVSGTKTLLFVAPIEKLGYEFGTGVMAHVSHQHDPNDGVPVNLNGKKLIVHVDERDIPTEGWRRLRLDEGTLYGSPDEPISTVRGQVGGWLDSSATESASKARKNTWTYWYCKALSAIMTGRNVSVSVGPLTLEKAKQVAEVAESNDPAAANDLRKFVNRRTSRDVRQVAEGVEVTRATLEGDGNSLVTSDEDFLVPSTDGQTVSLKTWPKGQALKWQDAQGLIGRPRFMKVGDTVERMQFARMIQQNGYKLVL
jgi:hypothetical protein